jgi:hypothetical protein
MLPEQPMSHDELSQIIARLDRLETKVDTLASRFDTHDGCATAREQSATETRRWFLTVLGSLVVTALVAIGSAALSVMNHIGGTK